MPPQLALGLRLEGPDTRARVNVRKQEEELQKRRVRQVPEAAWRQELAVDGPQDFEVLVTLERALASERLVGGGQGLHF